MERWRNGNVTCSVNQPLVANLRLMCPLRHCSSLLESYNDAPSNQHIALHPFLRHSLPAVTTPHVCAFIHAHFCLPSPLTRTPPLMTHTCNPTPTFCLLLSQTHFLPQNITLNSEPDCVLFSSAELVRTKRERFYVFARTLRRWNWLPVNCQG